MSGWMPVAILVLGIAALPWVYRFLRWMFRS